MALNIKQFRQKYPQFSDVNDTDLTRALHQRFSPNTPLETFKKKFIGTATAFPERRRIESPDIRFYGPQDLLTTEVETPELYKRIKQEIPQSIGGEVGAGVGAAVGSTLGPVGVAGGAIAGAFVGGAAGKGYQQAYRMYKGTSDAPRSFGQIYKEQAFAGGEEAVSEGLGRGGVAIGGKLLKPFRRKLIKEAPDMIKLAKRYGTHLTPGQLTDAWMADTLETIADASFFGGRGMKKLKLRTQPQAIARYADDLAEIFTKKVGRNLDPDTIGKLVDDALGERNKIFMNQAKSLYSNVDKLTEGTLKTLPMTETGVSRILSEAGEPLVTETTKMVERNVGGATVNISSLKEFAEKATKSSAELKGIGASEAGEGLLGKIKQLDDNLSFKAAQELRSRLLREETALGVTKDKAKGLAKKLVSLTDSAIDSGGKNLSPEALEAFRTANRFYKQGKEKYSNKIIRNLIQTVETRGEPEKIIPYIFQNKGLSRIKKTKAALGAESTAWKSLKAKYVENLISPRPDKIIGSNVLGDLQKMGEPALKEIFQPEELVALRKLGQWSHLVGGKASREMATGGSMVVQLVQGGAVLSVLSGQFQEIATPVFVLPEVIAQLATHKTTAKWLSDGFDLPVGSPEASALATRLMFAVRRIEKDSAKKRGDRPVFGTPTNEDISAVSHEIATGNTPVFSR